VTRWANSNCALVRTLDFQGTTMMHLERELSHGPQTVINMMYTSGGRPLNSSSVNS